MLPDEAVPHDAVLDEAVLVSGIACAHLFTIKMETTLLIDQTRIDEILKPADADKNARREADVRAKFWRTLKRSARQMPFMQDVVAAYYVALDNRTPLKARGMLLAALAYFVLPVDLVPDFIVGFGFTDDVAVLTAAIGALRAHITPAHREMARSALEDINVAQD